MIVVGTSVCNACQVKTKGWKCASCSAKNKIGTNCCSVCESSKSRSEAIQRFKKIEEQELRRRVKEEAEATAIAARAEAEEKALKVRSCPPTKLHGL